MVLFPPWLAEPPRAVLRHAERIMLQCRDMQPDMEATVDQALALIGCTSRSFLEAGAVVARMVARHAASFGAAGEPAYHDLRHQAEATRAMGWLCACALRLRAINPDAAAAAIVAIAGHDLLHDGSFAAPGALEVRSADHTAALATAAGVSPAALDIIRRVILATDSARPAGVAAGDDMLCRLGQEADLFGSLTPDLGWRLSQALAREAEAAGRHFDPPFDTYAGRLRLLRMQRPPTAAGSAMGLGTAVADEIAALARIGDGDAVLGASRLDVMPAEPARDRFKTALAAVVAG